MNKKADIVGVVDIIEKAIFLVIVVGVIVAFVVMVERVSVNTQQLDAELFFNHLLYSESGISYYDSASGIINPGVIDKKILNGVPYYRTALDDGFYYKSSDIIAANITLYDLSGNKVANSFYNKKHYLRWKPLTGRSGSGAVTAFDKRMIVSYDKGLKEGLLVVEMLLPNS